MATGYITGVRNVLASTANTEIIQKPVFLRILKDASAYANQCRFGHTFRGSFGFTVESPLNLNDNPTLPPTSEDTPFARRVMERFARGIRSISAAADANETKPIIDSVTDGFGANTCEQLAKLIRNTAPTGITFEFSFSPEWRLPKDIIDSVQFKMGPLHVEIMETAAKELRNRPAPIEGFVVGKVTKLQTEENPSDLLNPEGERVIVVHGNADEIGEIYVYISLNPEQYLAALEAHKDGRLVLVDGTLERRSWRGPWIIEEPASFGFFPGS